MAVDTGDEVHHVPFQLCQARMGKGTVDAAIDSCFPLLIDYAGRQLIVQGDGHTTDVVSSNNGVGYLAETNIAVLSSRWSNLGSFPSAMGARNDAARLVKPACRSR